MKIENLKLKIGINGYFLTRPYTGFGVYTLSLLRALGRVVDPEKYEFMVFTPQKISLSLPVSLKIEVIPEVNKKIPALNKLWWEQVILPHALRANNIKLVHHLYPSTIVFNRGIKQITSIHDATPWHFREHNSGLKVKLLHRFMIWSNRRADLVVSVSNYGRNDVSQIYGIPKQKIEVVYNGVDNRFRSNVTAEGKKAIRAKYNLPSNYIFYVGGFEVHKNVKRLFLAYARAVSELKQDLIIAGGVFSKVRTNVYKDYYNLPKLIKNYQLEHRVKMIGVVPDQDLPALYQTADLYIMPSLAEGFNLPLVQAFASKVPAIASNIPASIEIAGRAALLIDTTNIDQFATAIVKLLADKEKQKNLIANGLERQAQFSWEQSATRLVGIYDRFFASLANK